MNILLTGRNGFLGSSLLQWFNNKPYYNIYAPDRQELNLLNINDIRTYIDKYKIDCIINAAWKQNIDNNRYYPDSNDSLCENLLIFNNLCIIAQEVKYLFLFGTGSEYGTNVCVKSSEQYDIKQYTPTYIGSLIKNLMATKVSVLECKSCYYLRIFGMFGPLERPDRFIKSNLLNIINHKPIIIHQNRWFDFIYVNDIGVIIDYTIRHNHNVQHDINCVYNKKHTLLDIAHIMLNITQCNQDIIIEKYNMGLNYMCMENMLPIDTNLSGIRNGIIETYRQLLDKQ